jgi:hypothetical protein
MAAAKRKTATTILVSWRGKLLTLPRTNVIPAKAGTHSSFKFDIEDIARWVPTVVGMTIKSVAEQERAT